ncbi:MAG: type I methionyl aminopeptidase [Candidatus Liptonbacteria bacterium]|nr:type I methionyl aminopeptidase [Candidatus Liptonbacteria bacterium]
MGFKIKTKEEIEIMAEGGRRLGEILASLASEVRPGIGTAFFDTRSFALIKKAGCEPAFLNYRPTGAKKAYPATICVSINDVVVHGVPSKRVIEDGDIVSLDLGLKYKGWYVDAAVSVGAGKLDTKKYKLIAAAKNALELGIGQAMPGKTLGDIGCAIEKFVKQERFSIVEGLTGHGIGRELHEEPAVFNFGKPGKGEPLKVGMVIAIEPMISAGGAKIRQLQDDSYAIADGSLAAHFEHTIAITENGPRVLTK